MKLQQTTKKKKNNPGAEQELLLTLRWLQTGTEATGSTPQWLGPQATQKRWFLDRGRYEGTGSLGAVAAYLMHCQA